MELWTTEQDIEWAEAGLAKLEFQYRSNDYDEEYDLKSEIKTARERIRQSKNKLLK